MRVDRLDGAFGLEERLLAGTGAAAAHVDGRNRGRIKNDRGDAGGEGGVVGVADANAGNIGEEIFQGAGPSGGGWVLPTGITGRGRCFNRQRLPISRQSEVGPIGDVRAASKAIGAGSAVSRRRNRSQGRSWRGATAGHREAANQAFGAPIEFRLSAELQLDAGDHASCSEAARRRLLNQRPAGLHPYDLENVCPRSSQLDRQPARQRRQRAIFRRIGDELVQRQRQRLRGRRLKLDLRTATARSGRRSNRARAPRRPAF